MYHAADARSKLSPEETLRQISALAEHLARAGVNCMPVADEARAGQLRDAFDFALPADRVETTTPAPSSESPSSESPSSESPSAGSQSPGSQSAGTRPATTQPACPSTDSEAASEPRPRSAAAARSTASASTSAFTLQGGADQNRSPYPGQAFDPQQRRQQLEALSEQVAACTRCEALSKCRTQTVFGEGNVTPRVVFFGEAPGRDEDLSGRPFVGKAGQLLTKMIKACQFQREDVYILNTVKCRPPNNRNPEPTEVENCREYFEAQLNLLRPEYIVCLGLVSAQALLRTKLSVGKMRGRFHNHFDSKVIVTYHPSYLLRNPAAKKAAWEDLQIMLRDAGLIERQKNSS